MARGDASRARRGGHFLVGLMLLSYVGCYRQPQPREVTFTGDAQGTTYTVKVVLAGTSANPAVIEKRIAARLDQIDREMSTYRSDSEITRFNESRDTTPVPASRDLVDLFLMAGRVSQATDGAFDVTVKPVVDAWGFGPKKRTQDSPTETELAAIRDRVGYRKVIAAPAASTLRKTRPDISCDLNAIAPGYTVDTIAADLDASGCADYVVELGGEVKARGKNAEGLPWQVGIEKATGSGGVEQAIALDNAALSTSGDYRAFYERDGVRFSHTIDPRTLRPITHALASVSVIDPSCAVADAYATALMVLGPDEGYALALRLAIPAFFVIHEGADRFTRKATPLFAERDEHNCVPDLTP